MKISDLNLGDNSNDNDNSFSILSSTSTSSYPTFSGSMTGANPEVNLTLTDKYKEIEDLKGEIAATKKLLNSYKGFITKEFKANAEEIIQIQKESQAKTDKIEQIQREAENLKTQMKEEKINFIIFSGLFVAIFTVLSIQISILQNVTVYLRIAGLSLILIGSILLFFMLINYIAKSFELNKPKIMPSIMIGILILFIIGLGGIFLHLGDDQYIDKLQTELKEIQSEIDELKQRVYIPSFQETPTETINIPIKAE